MIYMVDDKTCTVARAEANIFLFYFALTLFTISAYRLASKCIAEISRNRDSTWSNDNTRGRHLQHSSNNPQLEN